MYLDYGKKTILRDFFLRKARTNKAGLAPILVRITTNGVSKEVYIQCFAPANKWNQSKVWTRRWPPIVPSIRSPGLPGIRDADRRGGKDSGAYEYDTAYAKFPENLIGREMQRIGSIFADPAWSHTTKGGAHGIRNNPYTPRFFIYTDTDLKRVLDRSVILCQHFPDSRFRVKNNPFAYHRKRYLLRIAQRLQGSGRDMQQIANFAARQVVFCAVFTEFIMRNRLLCKCKVFY